MSCIGITGNVRETYGELLVEWQIPDFYSGSEFNCFYQSPVFCGCDACWSLRIYPKGKTDTSSWVGLYLARVDSGPPRRIKMSFGIKTADGEEKIIPGTTVSLAKKVIRGTPKFISIPDLLTRRSHLTPKDVLTVTCNLTDATQHSSAASLFSSLWILSLQMKRMLHEGKETDFVLKLGGRELRAHRAILQARCGYFAGMLGSDFQENKTGEGDISDIEEGVFQCILSYLYTGEAEGMSDQNVCKIYVAADKLLLWRLKQLCIDYMKKKLSLDLICDVMALVETCEEGELKELALEYFAQNADEVFDSDRWKEFKEEHDDLVPELLEKVVVRRKKLESV